jgi:hypothetical protein
LSIDRKQQRQCTSGKNHPVLFRRTVRVAQVDVLNAK